MTNYFLSHFVYCGSPLHYKYNFMCWDTCRACSLIICTAKDTSSDKHKRRPVLCCALHEECRINRINQKPAESFLLLVPFAIPDVISQNNIKGMHSFTYITFYNIHFTRKILPARTAPTLQQYFRILFVCWAHLRIIGIVRESLGCGEK